MSKRRGQGGGWLRGWYISCAIASSIVALSLPNKSQAAPPVDAEGIRIGNARFYPYAEVDSHFVTNPGRLPKNSLIAEQPTSDAAVSTKAGMSFWAPMNNIDLSLDGKIDYKRYLGVNQAYTKRFSRLAGDLSVALRLNEDGAVAVRLGNEIKRSADPGNQSTDVRLVHVTNNLQVAVDAKPSETSLFTLEYRFFYDRYDRDSLLGPTAARNLDNMRHMPSMNIGWEVFADTKMGVDVGGTITSYPKQTASNSNLESKIINANLGIQGRIASRMQYQGKVGYSHLFLEGPGNDIDSLIGKITIHYAFTGRTRINIGYAREVAPTSFFGSTRTDKMQLGGTLQLFERTNVGLRAAYSLIDYSEPSGGQVFNRKDKMLSSSLSVSYRLSRLITLSFEDTVGWRTSNYDSAVGNSGYFSNDAMFRVAVHY